MPSGLLIGQIVILALVQGITEFLPISSSAHLILVPVFTDWPDQGPMIDVAVHVGTLGAVLIYFRREVADLSIGLGTAVLRRPPRGAWRANERMALFLVVATLPIILAGLLLYLSGGQLALRHIAVIGWASLGFGVLLYIADRWAPQTRFMAAMLGRDAAVIGLAQILALIPGTSRAGITMTAARALGYNREEAARFSMLLSIPTIAAAGLLSAADMTNRGDAALGLDAVLAAFLAFLTALAAIDLLLRWLRRASFTPFVVYRVVLGILLLAVAYGVF